MLDVWSEYVILHGIADAEPVQPGMQPNAFNPRTGLYFIARPLRNIRSDPIRMRIEGSPEGWTGADSATAPPRLAGTRRKPRVLSGLHPDLRMERSVRMTNFAYQLYSSRKFPPLSDSLRMLAGVGYTQVEGYGALFADPVDLGQLKASLDACGLCMTSGHFDLDLVQRRPERVIEIARTLGIQSVFVPFISLEERSLDAAGWERFGRTLAEAGKPVRDAGLEFGWHNHSFEFQDLGGEDKPLDLILAGGDIALEFDVAWAVVGQQDPLEWIDRYGEKILAAHIKDLAPAGENEDEDGWADVGHGVMDWSRIMAALRATPCRHYVMEHDNPSDDQRFAARSLATARTI